MQQNIKSNISKEKILNAAIVEFGLKSYSTASLNSICKNNHIAKGLIYHYYKNKDDLYLMCVKSCFDSLSDCLKSIKHKSGVPQIDMQTYLDKRSDFFRNNPYYSNIFFNALLQPPAHLINEILALRREFDEVNITQYKILIKQVTLRDGITEDEAIEYFLLFQEAFNHHFQYGIYEKLDFDTLINIHELKLSKALNMILYGIAK